MEFTKENSSEATFLEIKRLIKEFQDKFNVKTTNTEGFLTINELETLWSKLRNNTDVLYSDMINHFMSTIDEKELISKKKREFYEKGIILRTDKRTERTVLTLNGQLRYSRNILRPLDIESKQKLLSVEGLKSVAPLDIALGLNKLPFKMTLATMLRAAYWAQNQCSYQKAEDIMKNVYGIFINDDTIRLITNYVGEIVFKADSCKADEIYSLFEQGKIPYNHDKNGILYIETDGAALNTRLKDEKGSTWRENKLGVVFSSDNIHTWHDKHNEKQHRILKREYTSYIGSCSEFRKHLLACAIKNGYGTYKKTILLSDGATWIRNLCEDIFPDAQQILDYFHLSENVYTYAKYLF